MIIITECYTTHIRFQGNLTYYTFYEEYYVNQISPQYFTLTHIYVFICEVCIARNSHTNRIMYDKLLNLSVLYIFNILQKIEYYNIISYRENIYSVEKS